YAIRRIPRDHPVADGARVAARRCVRARPCARRLAYDRRLMGGERRPGVRADPQHRDRAISERGGAPPDVPRLLVRAAAVVGARIRERRGIRARPSLPRTSRGRPADIAVFASAFGHLTAPLGVYAIAGNHDVYAGWSAVRRRLEAMGVTVLVNRAVQLTHNGASFWLAGTGDPAGAQFVRGQEY